MLSLDAALALPIVFAPATYLEDGGDTQPTRRRRKGGTMADDPQTKEHTNGSGLAGVVAQMMATTNALLQSFGERLGLVEKFGPRLDALEDGYTSVLARVDQVETHLKAQDAATDAHSRAVTERLDAVQARVETLSEGITSFTVFYTTWKASEQHRRERMQRLEAYQGMVLKSILDGLPKLMLVLVTVLVNSLANQNGGPHRWGIVTTPLTAIMIGVTLAWLLLGFWRNYKTQAPQPPPLTPIPPPDETAP